MDHYDYEGHELLQEAVDIGLIEEMTTALGVALQWIDSGYDSLSPAEKNCLRSARGAAPGPT